LRKENLREQAIYHGLDERPEGCFAGQVSCMTEMTNAKNGLRALGGIYLQLEKPMAIKKEPKMSFKK
jgi:hypothetical protein